MAGPHIRVPITHIRPGPERHYFGHDNLRLLADKMQAFGLVHPILVKRAGHVYEIVSGKRRWLAAQMLGWRSMDVQVES